MTFYIYLLYDRQEKKTGLDDSGSNSVEKLLYEAN